MQFIKFPLQLTFKIGTIANDFVATDATGEVVAYVKQKMFKLKEDIVIYADESKTDIVYRIKADRWLDFSAAYSFYDESGAEFGKIVRKGWRSIWKASYELIDENNEPQYKINEENPWIKVGDALLGQIPLVGMLTGYLFNPAYIVTDKSGNIIARLKKQPSFWGRKFDVDKEGEMDNDDDDRILLGLMMLILLERSRG